MTAKRVAKDFGRYLQSCRRARGVSLEIVSHQTKITVENLRHIENERLDQLPSPVFVKGFVKSYAHAVGADPSKAALRLENHFAPKDQALAVSVQMPSAGYNWYHLATALVLFAALIGGTLIMAGQVGQTLPVSPDTVAATNEAPEPTVLGKKSSDQAKTASPPVKKALVPANNALEMEKATITNVEPIIEKTLVQPVNLPAQVSSTADNLELRMSAVEATWLKVASDDKLPREYLLQADQYVTLMAQRQFSLTIGNAGGIRLMLNDQPVQVRGISGQVVNLRLP